ncbi:MAG: zinc-ribbon domain-containing protein [Candidatus Heimdallarchaeota archaeon]|nr:zinc-ribbon domain-containing protein [Candidatus Heimdallarchaeota archaeon]
MTLKRKSDILGFLFVLMALGLLSVSLVQAPSGSYSLNYGEYVYFRSDNQIGSSYHIHWSFEGVNSVGITVYAMTQSNYNKWVNGYSANVYTLSSGDYFSDSGTFTPSSEDYWYIVFLHKDGNNLFQSAGIDVEVRFSLINLGNGESLSEIWTVVINVLKIVIPIIGGILVLYFIIWGIMKLNTLYDEKKQREKAQQSPPATAASAAPTPFPEELTRDEFITNAELVLLFFCGLFGVGFIIAGSFLKKLSTFLGVLFIILGVILIVYLVWFLVIRYLRRKRAKEAMEEPTQPTAYSPKPTSTAMPMAQQEIKPSEPSKPSEAEKPFPSEQPAVKKSTGQVFCWKCGEPNAVDQKFCGECGAKLTGSEPSD